jgi:hypothetical protein
MSIATADFRAEEFVPDELPSLADPHHPAPYPLELAERLIRMFSFVGDTVLDPFLGTGTTTLAAMRNGRNSIGYEIDKQYLSFAERRIQDSPSLFATSDVSVSRASAGSGSRTQGLPKDCGAARLTSIPKTKCSSVSA